jgi:hypothetical protein
MTEPLKYAVVIALHLEGVREHGEVAPTPTTKVEYVDAR